MDADVFKALADDSRRQLLDRLFERDGQSLSELCAGSPFSRQAVSKHLAILEAAGLVTTHMEGRLKRHYLNPMPIHAITDRWLAKYSQRQLAVLADLKHALEREEHASMNAITKNETKGQAMPAPEFQYATWIRTTPDALWQALTQPEFTSRYFHATHIDSTFEPGAAVTYRYADGRPAVVGEVLVAEPPSCLSITWHVRYDEAAAQETPSRVTFRIEPEGEQCRLLVVHDRFPAASVVLEPIREGWPWIIASLKSLLETGEPLPPAGG